MREPAKCGTMSGYVRHHKRREPACDDCKAAQAAYARERRADPERRARANEENRKRYAKSAEVRLRQALANQLYLEGAEARERKNKRERERRAQRRAEGF